jgi:fructose transport system ATP-binding protein
MQNVFEHADRIQIMRLGRRAGIVSPRTHTMQQTIAVMTGAASLDAAGRVIPTDGDAEQPAGMPA